MPVLIVSVRLQTNNTSIGSGKTAEVVIGKG